MALYLISVTSLLGRAFHRSFDRHQIDSQYKNSTRIPGIVEPQTLPSHASTTVQMAMTRHLRKPVTVEGTMPMSFTEKRNSRNHSGLRWGTDGDECPRLSIAIPKPHSHAHHRYFDFVPVAMLLVL